jgi:hypothetical protein
LPLVGVVVVVVVVTTVAGVVPVDRDPPVVVVVISPRRYLPSSVPPQAEARSSPAAITAVAGFTLRRVNRRPPETPTVRKRRSLVSAVPWRLTPPLSGEHPDPPGDPFSLG